MNEYRIVQNGGGAKLWRISNFKKLAGKTLGIAMNYPSLVAMCYAIFK